MLRNFVKNSKHDPLVQKVHLIEANPAYARVKFDGGRESNVSLRDLAPCPVANPHNPNSDAQDSYRTTSANQSSPDCVPSIEESLVETNPQEVINWTPSLVPTNPRVVANRIPQPAQSSSVNVNPGKVANGTRSSVALNPRVVINRIPLQPPLVSVNPGMVANRSQSSVALNPGLVTNRLTDQHPVEYRSRRSTRSNLGKPPSRMEDYIVGEERDSE